MVRENKTVLFEGRDTQNRKILYLGIGLFVFIGVVSALMIPLCVYLWDLSYSASEPSAQPAAGTYPASGSATQPATGTHSSTRSSFISGSSEQLTSMQQIMTPEIILEVSPNQDLQKMRSDIEKAHTEEKIKQAMQTALEKGFPARKS